MKYTYDGIIYDVQLIDEGTLDTVFSVNGVRYGYDSEFIRNEQGRITDDSISTVIEDYLEEQALTTAK